MKDLNRPIYALDLRNHGTSPHAAPMDYESMAQDVHHFMKQHGLSDVSVMGHSLCVFSIAVVSSCLNGR